MRPHWQNPLLCWRPGLSSRLGRCGRLHRTFCRYKCRLGRLNCTVRCFYQIDGCSDSSAISAVYWVSQARRPIRETRWCFPAFVPFQYSIVVSNFISVFSSQRPSHIFRILRNSQISALPFPATLGFPCVSPRRRQ